jgi:hypothetical protein
VVGGTWSLESRLGPQKEPEWRRKLTGVGMYCIGAGKTMDSASVVSGKDFCPPRHREEKNTFPVLGFLGIFSMSLTISNSTKIRSKTFCSNFFRVKVFFFIN